jgi:predicted nucleotidyltransferase
MKIDKSQIIAGYPAIQMRDFLRKFRFSIIELSTIQQAFRIDSDEAKMFLRRAIGLGYLKSAKDFSSGERQTYEITPSGLELANASAAKPITRETAGRLLMEFMGRVQAINAGAEDQYAYRVESVVLFGSMLSDKERLGDVDIAVELQPATSDAKEFDDLCRYRHTMARVDERHFNSDFERFAWPATEIFNVLRARSWSLALHHLSDLSEMQNVSYRVLHGDEVRLRSMIPGGIPI